MRISVVTPSFRGSPWLRLCVESVADQEAEVEHIVQDAGSDDGTLEWLRGESRVKLYAERDQGMYDAINRGFRRAKGEVLAYLNCDEQYLPNALRQAGAFFEQRPDVDILFGDVVFVDSEGQYLYHRKMLPPLLYHTWVCHLSTLSAGMFFRRHLFFDRKLEFDPTLRDVGDGEWMVRALRSGAKTAVLHSFTSAFTMTGKNMSKGANAMRENRELRDSAPFFVRNARPLLVLHHRIRRWLGGMYSQRPFSFEIYTRQSPDRRLRREVRKPISRATS